MRTVSSLRTLYISNPSVPLDMSLPTALLHVPPNGTITISPGHHNFSKTLTLARNSPFTIMGQDECTLEIVTEESDKPLFNVRRGEVREEEREMDLTNGGASLL